MPRASDQLEQNVHEVMLCCHARTIVTFISRQVLGTASHAPGLFISPGDPQQLCQHEVERNGSEKDCAACLPVEELGNPLDSSVRAAAPAVDSARPAVARASSTGRPAKRYASQVCSSRGRATACRPA